LSIRGNSERQISRLTKQRFAKECISGKRQIAAQRILVASNDDGQVVARAGEIGKWVFLEKSRKAFGVWRAVHRITRAIVVQPAPAIRLKNPSTTPIATTIGSWTARFVIVQFKRLRAFLRR